MKIDPIPQAGKIALDAMQAGDPFFLDDGTTIAIKSKGVDASGGTPITRLSDGQIDAVAGSNLYLPAPVKVAPLMDAPAKGESAAAAPPSGGALRMEAPGRK